MKLYADGTIETGQLYRINKNGSKTEANNTTPPVSSTNKLRYVRLGSGADSFDEYITVSGKVKKAGDRSELFNTFDDNSKIPSVYKQNENRFNQLASDPDHGGAISVGTRREAMAGLEAEKQGLIASPITRDPSGAEFLDGNGVYWDVKTPPGTYFNLNSIGNSIKSEITLTSHKVILDCSYISQAQLLELRSWLIQNLTLNDLAKIIEVNTKIF